MATEAMESVYPYKSGKKRSYIALLCIRYLLWWLACSGGLHVQITGAGDGLSKHPWPRVHASLTMPWT